MPTHLRTLASMLAVLLVALAWPHATMAQQAENDGLMAVVVVPRGDATNDLARDLQELLSAALGARGNFEIIGKEELRDRAGYKDIQALEQCLGRIECIHDLEMNQRIEVFVIARINEVGNKYEFASTVTRPGTNDTHFSFELEKSGGVDALLERLYEFADEIDLTPRKKQEAVVVPQQKKDDKEDLYMAPVADSEPLFGPLGIAGMISGGAGILAIGAGLAFNLQAVSSSDSLQHDIDVASNRSGGAQGITRARAKELEREANDAAGLANIFYGVGIVALAAGTLMFTFDVMMMSQEAAVAVGPWFGPEGANGSVVSVSF